MVNRKPLSPSQIAKLQEMLGATLRKANPFSDEAQDLIENHWDELEDELKAGCIMTINCVLEQKRGIIRHVKVNRARTPQQALDAIGCVQHINHEVVEDMPRGEGEEVDVHFFLVGHYKSDEDLEKECESRGLVPADPFSLAAVNEADLVFAREHPNCTHWKDKGDRWCYFACGGDGVRIYRRVASWSGSWWFAGVRKQVA